MLRCKALGFTWHVPAFGEEVGMWRSHTKKQAKSAHNKGVIGQLIGVDPWGNGTSILIAKGTHIQDPELVNGVQPKTVAVECLRLSKPVVTPEGWNKDAMTTVENHWNLRRKRPMASHGFWTNTILFTVHCGSWECCSDGCRGCETSILVRRCWTTQQHCPTRDSAIQSASGQACSGTTCAYQDHSQSSHHTQEDCHDYNRSTVWTSEQATVKELHISQDCLERACSRTASMLLSSQEEDYHAVLGRTKSFWGRFRVVFGPFRVVFGPFGGRGFPFWDRTFCFRVLWGRFGVVLGSFGVVWSSCWVGLEGAVSWSFSRLVSADHVWVGFA